MLQQLLIALGYGLCHQLPERSFFAGGLQLPVCARDTGIYLGFALSVALISSLERHRRATEPPSVWLIAAAVAMIGAMAYDGLTSYMGLRQTTNDIRLATGLMTGYGLSLIVVPMLNGQLWREARRERVLDRTPRAFIWLASLPLAFLVVRFVAPLLGAAYPLLTAVAIIVTFMLVNLLIVTLLPSLERRAQRLRDLRLQVALAGALTVVELLAASWIRVLAERLI